MKLEINSSNIMTWVDGEYGTFTASSLRHERTEGDLIFSTQPISIAEGGKYANLRDNFETDQTQMLGLLVSHVASVQAHVANHPGWKLLVRANQPLVEKLVSVAVLTNALRVRENKPVPHTESVLIDSLGLQAVTKHFTVQNDLREVELFWDDDHYPRVSKGLLAKIPFAAVEQANLEHETLFHLFGHLSYLYAKDSEDMLQWLQACTVAFHINNSAVKKWTESNDGIDNLFNT